MHHNKFKCSNWLTCYVPHTIFDETWTGQVCVKHMLLLVPNYTFRCESVGEVIHYLVVLCNGLKCRPQTAQLFWISSFSLIWRDLHFKYELSLMMMSPDFSINCVLIVQWIDVSSINCFKNLLNQRVQLGPKRLSFQVLTRLDVTWPGFSKNCVLIE